MFFADGTSGSAVAEGYLIYVHSSNYMALGTANTERLRIDSSGRVGVGTTSPGAQLEVHGSSTARFFGGSGSDATLAIGSTGASNDAVIIKYDNTTDRLQFYNWGAGGQIKIRS